MSGKIKVFYCKSCDTESKDYSYCYKCGHRMDFIERDKKRVTGNFEVVDWFSSRSSAGLVIEDKSQGIRESIFMSDLFDLLKGKNIGQITLEETKKGSAYSWKIIND